MAPKRMHRGEGYAAGTGDDVSAPRWSTRESELLAVTLKLFQETGFERLVVEDVAIAARSSKATLYRRWPTKGDLVIAAIVAGMSPSVPLPDTGALRDDLILLAETMRKEMVIHAATVRAVLAEASHNVVFDDFLRHCLVGRFSSAMTLIMSQAVSRGEIDPSTADRDEVMDLLPGYVMYRAVLSERSLSSDAVRTLIDEFILPSLWSDKAEPSRVC